MWSRIMFKHKVVEDCIWVINEHLSIHGDNIFQINTMKYQLEFSEAEMKAVSEMLWP
jgi:hypothetical protein